MTVIKYPLQNSVWALLHLVCIFLATTAYASASLPVVNLGYVSYRGYQNATAGINYYRGIPYAQPPLGSLRWRKPQPIEHKNNFAGKIINATKIAPFCYQCEPGFLAGPAQDSTPQSENCLILDILVPMNPVSKALPVMLQIHGGGYTVGSAQSYPGDAIVNASNGTIIYVSIQYRLGMFGFLGGDQIATNGTLNAGLLDQREALAWVSRHIHAFGGDPNRVTIWGGSAGGGSVAYQLIANGGAGTPPFSGAIAEYPWWQPLANATTQKAQYNTALRLANCTDLNCLRSLSSENLGAVNQASQVAAYPGPGDGYGLWYYGPVVDGYFIMDLPDQEFKKGNFYSQIALIVDHDAFEGALFSNVSVTTQVGETTDAKDIFPFAGPSFFSRLYSLYPASSFNSTFFQRQTWFGDFIINCPTYEMASAAVDFGTNSSAVWKLTFAAGSELHGATVPFLASNFTGFPSANNHTLAEIMANYWISFAVHHDPNVMRAKNAPYWPGYTEGGDGTVANGESVGFSTLAVTYTTIGNQTDPDINERCEFMGSRGWILRN